MRRSLVILCVLIVPLVLAAVCLGFRALALADKTGVEIDYSFLVSVTALGLALVSVLIGLIVDQFGVARENAQNARDFGASTRGRVNWGTWVKWGGRLTGTGGIMTFGAATILLARTDAWFAGMTSLPGYAGLVLLALGTIYALGGGALERSEWARSPAI